MSYSLVDLRWTPDAFSHYLASIPAPQWCRGVTLHHTASPSLAMRPNGLQPQHMRNLASFYRNEMRWRSGPHLFIDDSNILGLSPLTEPGTHARSFNGTRIGIEVLGDYDNEDPLTGRGLACWTTAAHATTLLLEWLGLADGAVNFHRDDPLTQKTCPGKIKKDWFAGLMANTRQPHLDDFVRISDVSSGLISRIPGGFLVDGHRLDTAFYDRTRQCTMASRAELDRLGLT